MPDPPVPSFRLPGANRSTGPKWTFELKFDGFRAVADTVNGRMLSKRDNRMHRFEALRALPLTRRKAVGCTHSGAENKTPSHA